MLIKKSPQADAIRIRHMIDAAHEALSFVKYKSRKDLRQNRQLLLSLTKEIEIIGEAASKISGDLQKHHPEIPWETIIATRNRLIHGYFDIDEDIVWETVTESLPLLVKKLKTLLSTL